MIILMVCLRRRQLTLARHLSVGVGHMHALDPVAASLFNYWCSAMQSFVEAAVLMYECGYNEDSLRQDLRQLALDRQGAGEPLSLGECDEEECLQGIGLVWMTLQLSPRAVKRWANGESLRTCTFKGQPAPGLAPDDFDSRGHLTAP